MQLAELQSANAYSNSKLEELSSRLFALQEEIEGNKLLIDRLKEEGKKENEEGKKNISDKEKQGKPLQKEVTKLTPSALFREALTLFNKKNYNGSLSKFDSFLKKHPKNKLAADAWYWVGEINYDRKNYKKAIEKYKKITEEFPIAEKIDSAILKLGLCYEKIDDKIKAKARFKEILDIYPNTSSAIIARQKLNGMK
jgi:tol-pal system protein YbgF